MQDTILFPLTQTLSQIEDEALHRPMDFAQQLLQRPFASRVGLLCDPYMTGEVIRQLCSQNNAIEALLLDLKPPFALNLRCGEDSSTTCTHPILPCSLTECSVPWPVLQKAELDVYGGFPLTEIFPELLLEFGALIVPINAAMALPQQQKEWLKQTAAIFPAKQIYCTLFQQQLLNTPNDFDQLCCSIRRTLESIAPGIRFQPDFSAALNEAAESAAADTSEKRSRRILENALNSIAQRASELLDLSRAKEKALAEDIKKMEAKRSELEISSRLTVEGRVESLYSQLRSDILQAADQYNEDAYQDIRQKIETTQNVAEDVRAIEPHLRSIWNHFETELQNRITEEQNKIAEELERAVELDCQTLIGSVGLAGQTLDWTARLDAVNQKDCFVLENPDQRKKAVRKLLVASFALAFFNPLLGLGGLVGTYFYDQKQKQNVEEQRKKVLEELYGICLETKEKVVNQICLCLEESKQRSREEVGALYAQTMKNTLQQITAALEQTRQLQSRQAQLLSLLHEEIVQARAGL